MKNIKKKIKFKALFELEDEFENRMKRISIENMKSFFGLQCINGMENEDDVNLNEYNYKEIEQILPHKEPKEKATEKHTQKKPGNQLYFWFPGSFSVAGAERLELSTRGFGDRCSTS